MIELLREFRIRESLLSLSLYGETLSERVNENEDLLLGEIVGNSASLFRD